MELTDLRSLRYAVVDVETTGTRLHRGDRIMEVAVVHVDDGIATTAAEFLVNPQRPVSPWVSRLTGLRWEMLHEAPTFGDIATRISEAVDGRVFVAHNVKFDWRFLSMELQRALGQCLKSPRLCTVRMARRLLSYLPRRNLDALAWHYEIPIVQRHRAGGDARATARILLRLLADAHRADVNTWDQLQALMREPAILTRRSALPQPVLVEAIA